MVRIGLEHCCSVYDCSPSVCFFPLHFSEFIALQVKSFGQLVKGFRSGIDLLLAVQKESNMIRLLCKLCKLPILVGKSGLEIFLSQFEAAIDSDFPDYQVPIYNLANSYLATKYLSLLKDIWFGI